ncbi:MAG: hypothetical protein D6731_04515 [Planctomycetota bacterium]|nr:MAG: hypothetical protein D6731_04515 [Planctomycetota bacterium]
MAGVRVALVHLVAQLDAELNRSFKALWERRPTLLHEELKKDPRFKDGIRLSLKDAWNPVVSPLPGGAHLQKRVLARLSEGGPKKKVESFLRLFKRTPPPEVTTRLLFDAIDVRNDYVHPSNEDQASGIIRASQPAWAPQPRTFPPP